MKLKLLEDDEVCFSFSIIFICDLLFSFLEPNRPHSALLAGYFGCLLYYLRSMCKDQLLLRSAITLSLFDLGCHMSYDLRKTALLMNYIKLSNAALP